MKSLSLLNLFSSRSAKVAGRTNLKSRNLRGAVDHRRAARHGGVPLEQLEPRLALAVDVSFQTPDDGPGEDWITVIANEGSDVYMQMASTPTNDLFIADNASFSGRNVVQGVNGRFDNIYVYHGVDVNRQAFDPADFDGDPSNNFGTVNGYPWLNGVATGGDLYHVLPSQGIDWTEAVSGVIDLNDGNASEQVYFRNAIAAGTPYDGNEYRDLLIYKGPGTGGNLVYSQKSIGGANFPQSTLTFDNDTIFGAGTGEEFVPTLALSYDADTRPRTAALNQNFINPQNMGAAVSASQSIQIFDPTQQQYVPGTLGGVLDVVFGPTSRSSLGYQVQESGFFADAGGDIPVSFNNKVGDVRNLAGDFGGFTWYDGNGAEKVVSLQAEADFDSVLGQLDVTLTIAEDGLGAPRPFSTYTSFASVALRDIDPTNRADDPTGLLFDPEPNSFTMFPGQDFTRGLVVDLVNPDSVVAIESPVISTAANSDQISLAATVVQVNAPVRAAEAFRIPSGENSAFGTVTEHVTVNAALSSPSFDIRLADSPETSSITRSRLVVSQTGSLSNLADVLQRPPAQLPPASQLFAEVIDGDVYVEGRINAAAQSYLITSPQLVADPTLLTGEYSNFEPYQFTTSSHITGIDTGLIEATTLAITLGNDTLVFPEIGYEEPFVPSRAFSVLDLSTDVDRIRVQASDRVNDPLSQPFPYILNVRENDDLIIDAVAASSLPMSFSAIGSIDLLATLESAGDVSLESDEQFVLGAPLMTQFGQIRITAPEVTVQNSIRVLDTYQDERDVDITIEVTDGDLTIEDGITAVNRVSIVQEGTGKVSGAARVVADVVEVVADGDVEISTEASRVYVRTPLSVTVEERTYGIFEIRDATNVTLIADGFDQVVTGEQIGLGPYGPMGGVRAYTAPALYADVYDTNVLTVSAPNGSVDVEHYGSGTLSVGDVSKIDAGTAVPMQAAGSVRIRSSLAAIDVYDAPSPTGNASAARVRTTEILGGAGDFTYERGSPGVVAPRLSNVRVTRENADGLSMSEAIALGQLPGGTTVEASFKYGRELDKIDVTTLRQGDRILVADGAAGVGGIANGIYFIVKVDYPVGDTSYVELDLVRVSDFDTTAELAEKHYVRISEGAQYANQVFTADGSERADGTDPQYAVDLPIYTGWGEGGLASGDYSFANVFDNDAETVPVKVRPILAQTGYVTAAAVTTLPLIDAGGNDRYAAEYVSGTITGTGSTYSLPAIDGVTLAVGDLVLVRYGAGNGSGQIAVNSPGLYEVASVGDGTAEQWELRRYEGVDEDGDGLLDEFFTGRVAIAQGTLRTARTGEMFEVSVDSLNFSPLRYQAVTAFSFDSTGEYDSVLEYRADIGSNNPVAPVRFVVSTELGTNDSVGSFGRMLTIFQANSARNQRTSEEQSQNLFFNPTVAEINLTQELPPIYRPIDIAAGSLVSIDGTQIVKSWEGASARAGSTATTVGPVRSSDARVARRLYRSDILGNDDRVHGLQILDTADGASISNLAIGGFVNGSAVLVVGADNVSLRQMVIGQTGFGGRLANEYGVEIQGGSVNHTTLANSTIVNSTKAGVLLGTNAEQVHIVNSAIGLVGEGNGVGVRFASNSPLPSYLGAAPIPGAVTTVQLSAVVEGVVGVGAAAEATLRVQRDALADDLRVGMVLYDPVNDIAREILEITHEADETVTPAIESYVVRVNNASVSGAETGEGELVPGETVTGQIGWLVEGSEAGVVTNPGKVSRGDLEVLLPRGINPGDIFLGQAISSFTETLRTGAVIEKIETFDLGLATEHTRITLSAPAVATGTTLLRIGLPGRNRIVGNSDGIVLEGNSSRTVNTLVSDSIYDGIRIERTDDGPSRGMHVIGDGAGTVPGSNPFIPGNPVTLSSVANVTILRNQLAGIRFSDAAFAALGAMNGTSVEPGDPLDSDRDDDYATIDTFLSEAVRIRGNYIGLDPSTSQDFGNGIGGIDNIVVDAEVEGRGSVERDRINFLLLGDSFKENPAGTGEEDDEVVSARLLANEGGIAGGLDRQFNRYGVGPGPNAGGGDREVTPPRRPIVRG